MVLGAKLARDRSENTRSDRLAVGVDQHGGVAVEADQRTIGAADALRDADDDGFHHLALLDAAFRDRLLNGDDDGIADGRVFAFRAAQHFDALNAARARVVGDVEIALHLDHRVVPSFSASSEALFLFAFGLAGSWEISQRSYGFKSALKSNRVRARLTPHCEIAIQRLFLEIGRVSSIETWSPTLNEFFSSCA